MIAPNFVHLNANGTTLVLGTSLRMGLVVINTKGATGNTLTLHNATTADASKIIAVIDTTTALGTLEYGGLALNALTAVLATGTAADVTISWG